MNCGVAEHVQLCIIQSVDVHKSDYDGVLLLGYSITWDAEILLSREQRYFKRCTVVMWHGKMQDL